MSEEVSNILDEIQAPNDIKNIDPKRYRELAREIRRFLVTKISRTGGHLASNLGVVELTMAIHLCVDLPKDKIVWDVGHQSYVHKLLTGRKDGFDTLRRYGGMSGFPKRRESECDAFDTGHSSTSVSVALGMAKARDLLGEEKKIFAVIGDGALTGGLAYEALNNATKLKSNLVIVLNDNQMSISNNVGGMSNYLGKIRTNAKYTGLKHDVEKGLEHVPFVGESIAETIRGAKDIVKRAFIPGMLFEDMGLTYIGPIDGHNTGQMVTAFKSALQMDEAVIVHVITGKGKGFKPAEENPSLFHGIGPFSVTDGEIISAQKNTVTYSDVFSESLIKEAEKNPDIVAVSAAMPIGTGLENFGKIYPERLIDVGIAEEHAVTFAAGMAAEKVKPVVAIYSTFLQRAYDEILHDVCLGGLPVVFAVDRAGLVGGDGETHHGIFDIPMFSQMPGMTLMAPMDAAELQAMLSYAINRDEPVAIRYPRGSAYVSELRDVRKVEKGKFLEIKKGTGVCLLAVGSMVKTAFEVEKILKMSGINPGIINARFVKPLDEQGLKDISDKYQLLVTMEEGVITGGFGQSVSGYYQNNDKTRLQTINIALPDKFIEHGPVDVLKKKYGIDAQSIANRVMEIYK